MSGLAVWQSHPDQGQSLVSFWTYERAEMRIKIRQFSSVCASVDFVIDISPENLVRDVRNIIFQQTEIVVENQNLYYSGKQLIDDHSIVDYNIQEDDVIQLWVKVGQKNAQSESPNQNEAQSSQLFEAESEYYNVGDFIDYKEKDNGAWFEAKIVKIFKKIVDAESNGEENFIFCIRLDRGENTAPFNVTFSEIRPRTYHTFSDTDLKPGITVLVNFNIEKPNSLGFWYDFKIFKLENNLIRGKFCTITRKNHAVRRIRFESEFMRIENCTLKADRPDIRYENVPLRKLPYYCPSCEDNFRKKCRECGCKLCAGKHNPDTLILCDDCNYAFHLACLNPALTQIPPYDWYCRQCKTNENEIVKPGEKLKRNKNNKNLRLSRSCNNGEISEFQRELYGEAKFGPVSDIKPGTWWKFRFQMCDNNIHRPMNSEIDYDENSGVFSILLDFTCNDWDNGEEIYYNLHLDPENKIVNDIKRAFCMSCSSENSIDQELLWQSQDWTKGKPVRVLRSHHGPQSSKFAPPEGYRYDGVYKIVEFFETYGKILRFVLRRDDPAPLPWMENSLRLNSKRKFVNRDSYYGKRFNFRISPQIFRFINKDSVNQTLWKECLDFLKIGNEVFFNKVEELFKCVCCHEVVYEPVTTVCKHNTCKECLKQCFKSDIYSCPHCRFELGQNYDLEVNKNLDRALNIIFPRKRWM